MRYTFIFFGICLIFLGCNFKSEGEKISDPHDYNSKFGKNFNKERVKELGILLPEDWIFKSSGSNGKSCEWASEEMKEVGFRYKTLYLDENRSPRYELNVFKGPGQYFFEADEVYVPELILIETFFNASKKSYRYRLDCSLSDTSMLDVTDSIPDFIYKRLLTWGVQEKILKNLKITHLD